MTSEPVAGGGRPVRAVIFDWGGTLTPWHEIDLAAQWTTYAQAVQPDPERAELLAEELLRAESVAWARAREEHRSARVTEILAAAGADLQDDGHQAAFQAYQGFWEPHTFTDAQVRPLWEGLHERGIRVGVLSNTIWTREYHRALLERDGVLHLVDGDVYSSEIDWAKPHPEAFLAVACAVGVDPHDAVYVGDRIFEDVHGPQQVGMRAVWIPHSTLPANQVVPVDAAPDATAHQLLDVLDIVDEWSR